MKKECLQILIGILIGLIIPGLIMFFMYKFYYKNYADLLGYNSFVIPKLLALCGISNMFIFYFCVNKSNKINIAKGIVIATLIYGLGILFYKLFY